MRKMHSHSGRGEAGLPKYSSKEDRVVIQRLHALGYVDDYSDESSGGFDASTLITAAASVGTTALLATQAPNSLAPGSYVAGIGNAYPKVVQSQTQASSLTTIAIVILLAIVGFFAFKSMK